MSSGHWLLSGVRVQLSASLPKFINENPLGLGDVPFKQPPDFTRRVLYNLLPGFHNVSPWEEFLVRNLTPPYITAEPDVVHRCLDESSGTSKRDTEAPWFLILASDGFADLCGSQEAQAKIINKWAKGLVSRSASSSQRFPWLLKKRRSDGIQTDKPDGPRQPSDNFALRLLRHALGEDNASVSRVLTLDMETAWIDDIAIVVQTL